MSLKIGNLLPGQEVKIIAQLVQPLQVHNSAFSFILPVAFYPDYRRLGADTDSYPYRFTYAVLIKSTEGVRFISKPRDSILEYDSSERFVTIFCDHPDREVQVFYRSAEMRDPQLLYSDGAELDPMRRLLSSEFENEIAAYVSFVPTFETIPDQGQIQIIEGEDP